MTKSQKVTDLEIMRECQLDGLKILGFERTLMNEWPEEEISKLAAIPGSTLIFTAITKSRFPIEGLHVQAFADGLNFNCRPVKSVVYPEKASLLPDPVASEENINVPGNTVMMFLFKADIPDSAGGTCREITIKVLSDTHLTIEKSIPLKISQPLGLPIENTWQPRILFWYHWKALCDYYSIELWSDEFWNMADSYLAEIARGGHNVIFMPITDDPFQYPLPKQYYRYHDKPSPIIWQHSKGKWSFDYTLYDKYIELNLKHGIDKEIECHSLLPCKRQKPVINYYDLDTNEHRQIATTYDSPEYRDIWQTFLADFVEHNRQKGWDHLLTLCPYDEPSDPETFRATAKMAKEVAPDIKICAAIQADIACELSDVLDIATLHLETGYDRAESRRLREKGVELRWYNCCYPDWGNTLFSCGLADAYRIPWITFANNFQGYLRWSVFDVTRDVYENAGFNWPTGDMFLLYPGKNGPEPSLRWETMKTGLEDVTLVAKALASSKLSEEKIKRLHDLIAYMGKDEAIELPINILDWRNEIYSCLCQT